MSPILDLLVNIRERPAMFIGRQSIVRFRSFLDGYRHGLRQSTVPAEEPLFDRFQRWVEERFKISTSHGWDSIILFMAGDDPAAFELFWELWDAYVQHCSAGYSGK